VEFLQELSDKGLLENLSSTAIVDAYLSEQ